MQKGRVVQEIQVRIVPGSAVKVFISISPRKVFVDEHEISVEQSQDHRQSRWLEEGP